VEVVEDRAAVAAELEAARARTKPADEPPKKPAPAGRRVEIEREGELWTVRLGDLVVRLKDSRGLEMLHHLVARPGQEIHALTLSAPSGGGAGGDSGEVLDQEAIDAYRERLTEVEDDLREAEAWNDTARAERARTEIELLRTELSRAVGLGGRARRAGSDAERARVNVQRRLRDAMRRIAEHEPAIGRHLDRAVRTGTFCSYVPEID
jgi:non-specific serine/threonine protein kinase